MKARNHANHGHVYVSKYLLWCLLLAKTEIFDNWMNKNNHWAIILAKSVFLKLVFQFYDVHSKFLAAKRKLE